MQQVARVFLVFHVSSNKKEIEMFRSNKTFFGMALLAIASFLGQPPPTARAEIEVNFYVDGVLQGSSPYASSGTSPLSLINYTVGEFTVTATIVGTQQTPGEGLLSIDNLIVTSTKAGTLEIVASANGFTAPPAPQTLNSNVGVSSGGNATGSLSYTSYVNPSNALDVTNASLSGLTTSGAATVNALNVQGSAGSNPVSVPGAGVPYSLSSVTTFDFTSAGTAGSTGTTDVVSTPAPGNLVLAASALPLLLGGWLLRRRKLSQLA